MAGFRGVEKIEMHSGEARVVESKGVEATAAPFAKPIRSDKEVKTITSRAKPEGLKQFLAMGARDNERELKYFTDLIRRSSPNDLELRPTTPDAMIREKAIDLPPPVRGLRSLLQNVFYYFKKTISYYLVPFVGGGGPMMIFGIFLFPGRDFKKAIEALDKKLAEFDRITEAFDSGASITLEEKRLIDDPDLVTLDQKRTQLKIVYRRHLYATYQDPEARLRREVEDIINEEGVDSPYEVIPYLAYHRGLSHDFFAGLLLRKAGPEEIREWLDIWAAIVRPEQRYRFPNDVIQWVRAHRPEAGVELLERYLKYEEPQIRLEAGMLLLEIGETQAATPVLLEIYQKAPAEVMRMAALMHLSQYGQRALIPEFLKILRSPHVSVDQRVAAAEFLGRWEVREAKSELRQLYERVKKEWKGNKGEEDYYFNLLTRTAKALHPMHPAVDLMDSFNAFVMALRHPNAVYHSRTLEEIPAKVFALEGKAVVPLLREMVDDFTLPPELRSGAILALAKTGNAEDAQLVWRVLENPHKPEGMRIAALRGLWELPDYMAPGSALPSPFAYQPFALALSKSPLLFVKLQAIEILLGLGAVPLVEKDIRNLLSIPSDMFLERARQLMKGNAHYASHEIQAALDFDSWAANHFKELPRESRLDLLPFDWKKIEPLLQSEWRRVLTEEGLAPPTVSEKIVLEAPERVIGKGLTDVILAVSLDHSQGRADAKALERLKTLDSKAVGTLAVAAKYNLYSITALLFLNHVGNPHTREHLLNLDLSLHLKSGPDLTMMKILNELAKVGHREAERVYKRWTN